VLEVGAAKLKTSRLAGAFGCPVLFQRKKFKVLPKVCPVVACVSRLWPYVPTVDVKTICWLKTVFEEFP
jgi:hypothetical protein